MSKEITQEKLITLGASKLAETLLSLAETDKTIHKQLRLMVTAREEGPKKLGTLLKKEIAGLKQQKRFVDYYEADALAHTLDQLRKRITQDLKELSAAEAAALLEEFLRLDQPIFERADDSNGAIGSVFQEACKDLGALYQEGSFSLEDKLRIVQTFYMNDDYSVFTKIIDDFQEALGPEGLEALKDVFQKDCLSDPSKALWGLKRIADLQKNVDAYIILCQEDPSPTKSCL